MNEAVHVLCSSLAEDRITRRMRWSSFFALGDEAVVREQAVGSTFAAGVLLGAILVALMDVARAALRMPLPSPPPVLALSWVVCTGALVTVAVPLLLSYRAAFRAAPEKLRFAVGAAAALGLATLGFVVEDSPSVTRAARTGVMSVLTVVGGAIGFAIVRWPRLGRAALLLVGSLLFVWLETVPTRGKPWLRFAIDLALLGACGAAVEGFRAKAPSPRVVLATVAAFAVAAPLGVLVRSTRLLIHEYGAHGSALIAWVAKVDPRRTPLGNVACTSGERPPSALVGRAPASKAAAGADVLFLSFDAMRWDHADAVAEVWRELGPHVRFTRALSPAPRTENAFAALLRGVPSRLAARREEALRLPTLAEVLVRHGYRAVQVPTHFYFGPGRFMNAGFELALTPEMPKKRRRIVPADSALRKALEIAKTTPKALFLSVHLMEGHEPYVWNGGNSGQGPATPAAQRKAFRYLDGRAAAFLREFRRERGSRPLIVAIFGDHGEEFGEHGGAYHSTSVYAEQVRVAFALSAPGVPETSVAAPVSLASIPATVVDLLGLDAARTFTEPSLLGCLANRADCPTLAVSQMIVLGSSVGYTFERHRLVVDPEHDLERLYDSEADPLEQNDLVPSEPALLDALRERALRFDRERCVPP
jgi:hypothetical protein